MHPLEVVLVIGWYSFATVAVVAVIGTVGVVKVVAAVADHYLQR